MIWLDIRLRFLTPTITNIETHPYDFSESHSVVKYRHDDHSQD